MTTLFRLLPLFALALIAGGLAAVYWPAALIAVGVLLWVDMSFTRGGPKE